MENKKHGGARPGAGTNKKIKVGKRVSFLPDEDLVPRIEEFIKSTDISRNRFLNHCVRYMFYSIDRRREIENEKTLDPKESKPEKDEDTIITNTDNMNQITVAEDGVVVSMWINMDGSVAMSQTITVHFRTNLGRLITMPGGTPNPHSINNEVMGYGLISDQIKLAKVMRDFENTYEKKIEDDALFELSKTCIAALKKAGIQNISSLTQEEISSITGKSEILDLRSFDDKQFDRLVKNKMIEDWKNTYNRLVYLINTFWTFEEKSYDIIYKCPNKTRGLGLKASLYYCETYIKTHPDIPIEKKGFKKFEGTTTVSIVCNETGEVIYEEEISSFVPEDIEEIKASIVYKEI